MNRMIRLTFALGPILLLGTSCGGGGDAEDGSQPLRISPAQVTATGPAKGACFAGKGPTIFAYGGVHPYRLRNSYADGVLLSTQEIGGPGQGVELTFTGKCFANLPIDFFDQTGRSVSAAITNQEGQ
jgi:hypothetical protein